MSTYPQYPTPRVSRISLRMLERITHPNRHTNTPLHIDTTLRHPRPGRRRISQLLTVSRCLGPDIQLRVHHIDVQIRIVL
jgi:hypothetical protein